MRPTVDYKIRPLKRDDEPLLWEMVYQALYPSSGEAAPPREIVQQPEFARYAEGWGRAGDTGFVAHDPERMDLLGAVWLRLHGNSDLPELAFSVTRGLRGRGIGTALLTQLMRANPQHSAILMHVAPTNPAVRLYERFGFRIVEQTDLTVLMRREA